MTHCLVLDPAPALIETGVRQACERGTDRRPGLRRAASCRTPCDTGPTDLTQPNESDLATVGAVQRPVHTARSSRDPRPHQAAARHQHRRSKSTTAGSSIAPSYAAAFHQARSPLHHRTGRGHQSTPGHTPATASMTGSQPDPSSPATSVTGRPRRPTCTVAQRPARSVKR